MLFVTVLLNKIYICSMIIVLSFGSFKLIIALIFMSKSAAILFTLYVGSVRIVQSTIF